MAEAIYGLTWANKQGFVTAEQGLSLAMSRILYDDQALADGEMFQV